MIEPNTTPFRVESYIPVPTSGGIKARYPWRSLNVGQSFFVPVDSVKDLDALSNSLTSCRAWVQRKTGRKFITRQTEVHGVFGIRVWRTA